MLFRSFAASLKRTRITVRTGTSTAWSAGSVSRTANAAGSGVGESDGEGLGVRVAVVEADGEGDGESEVPPPAAPPPPPQAREKTMLASARTTSSATFRSPRRWCDISDAPVESYRYSDDERRALARTRQHRDGTAHALDHRLAVGQAQTASADHGATALG